MAHQDPFNSASARIGRAAKERERRAALKAAKLARMAKRPLNVIALDTQLLSCELLLIAIEIKRERALREVWIALGLPLHRCVYGERSSAFWMAPGQAYAKTADFDRVFGFCGDLSRYGEKGCYGLEPKHLFDDQHPPDPKAARKFVTAHAARVRKECERHTRDDTLVYRNASGTSQTFFPSWRLVSDREDTTGALASDDPKERVRAAFSDLNSGEFKRLSNADLWYLDQKSDLLDSPISDGLRSVEGATHVTVTRLSARQQRGHRVGPEPLLCRNPDNREITTWMRPGDRISLADVLGDVATWKDLVARGLIVLDPSLHDPSEPYVYRKA